MTIESAEAEYERIKNRPVTKEELKRGYQELVEGMDKLKQATYRPARDMGHDSDPYP